MAINLNAAEDSLNASSKAVEFISGKPHVILVKSYSQIATSSRNLGNYADAIQNYKMAKQVAESLDKYDLAAWQLFRIGKMYVNYLHQPSRSLEYLTTAKSIFSQIDSYFGKRGVSSSIDEIGDLYRQHTSNIERAISFYQEAKKINEEIGYNAGITRNIAHLGLCEEAKGNFDTARKLLEESILLLRSIKSQDRGLAIRLGQLARILIKQKNTEMASARLKEASKISEYYHDVKHIASHKICLGQLYRLQKNYNLAKNAFNEAIVLGKKYNFNRIEMEAYQNLAEVISLDLEDYKFAQDVVLEEIKVRKNAWDLIADDSINLEKVENKKEIAFMYRSLFEKLLEDSHSDFNKALSAVKQAYNVAQEERNQKIINISKLFQLGALMAGVRHDSSNLLNDIVAIISLVLKDKSLSENSRKSMKLVKERILIGIESLRGDAIQKILSTRSSRSGQEYSLKVILPPIFEWIANEYQENKIKILFPKNIPDLTTTTDPTIIRMILSNIINNAREAADNSKKDSYIKIEITNADKQIRIVISDNGQGINESRLSKIFNVGMSSKPDHLGLGMPTVRYLLESIGGQINIKSEFGNGSDVTLFIPAN